MDLKTELSQFIGAESESDLFGKFKRLADNFLYGGYIQVRNEYRIYIQTVEFYFHSEKEDGIKDPIVYHRNGRELDEVPYFPLMTLHAHISGFDITFENPTLQYRASALIRAYEIKSKDGKYLYWNNSKQAFEKSETYKRNTQSTYLYSFLNGFALTDKAETPEQQITWIDSPREKHIDFQPEKRRIPPKAIKKWGYKNNEREWSFSRKDKV